MRNPFKRIDQSKFYDSQIKSFIFNKTKTGYTQTEAFEAFRNLTPEQIQSLKLINFVQEENRDESKKEDDANQLLALLKGKSFGNLMQLQVNYYNLGEGKLENLIYNLDAPELEAIDLKHTNMTRGQFLKLLDLFENKVTSPENFPNIVCAEKSPTFPSKEEITNEVNHRKGEERTLDLRSLENRNDTKIPSQNPEIVITQETTEEELSSLISRGANVIHITINDKYRLSPNEAKEASNRALDLADSAQISLNTSVIFSDDLEIDNNNLHKIVSIIGNLSQFANANLPNKTTEGQEHSIIEQLFGNEDQEILVEQITFRGNFVRDINFQNNVSQFKETMKSDEIQNLKTPSTTVTTQENRAASLTKSDKTRY